MCNRVCWQFHKMLRLAPNCCKLHHARMSMTHDIIMMHCRRHSFAVLVLFGCFSTEIIGVRRLMFLYIIFNFLAQRKLKWVYSQRKLSPKGLSDLFHANSTDLSRVIWLNFGLSLYLDHIFRLKISLSGVSAQQKSQRNRFTFLIKSGLRPNFSSAKGSAKG